MPKPKDAKRHCADRAYCSDDSTDSRPRVYAGFTDGRPDPTKKLIQTIPIAYTFTRELPTKEDKLLVRQKINQAIDLASELKKLRLFSRTVHLIALNLHYKEIWEDARDDNVRAKDLNKKILARCQNKSTQDITREKRIKKFTKAVTRLSVYEDRNRFLRGDSKKRLYYDRLLYDLWRMFTSRTDRPFKYVSAIVSLFNLNPESFCLGCPRYQIECPACKRKIQVVKRRVAKCECGEKLDHTEVACLAKWIFKCPRKDRARKKNQTQLSRSIFRNKAPRHH